MCEDRNDYGFPLAVCWGHFEYAGRNLRWHPNPWLSITPDQQYAENMRNGYFNHRAATTKLERAKAIAAEVCARRFPVTRINNEEK